VRLVESLFGASISSKPRGVHQYMEHLNAHEDYRCQNWFIMKIRRSKLTETFD